jgi:hypothetical protein
MNVMNRTYQSWIFLATTARLVTPTGFLLRGNENCSRFNCVYMFSFGFTNLIERRVITMNFVCVFNRTCQHFVFLAVKQYRMLLLFISCGSCLLKRLSLTQFSIVTCTTVVDRRCAQLYASSAISDFETYGLSDQRFCIRMKICVTEERPAMPAT